MNEKNKNSKFYAFIFGMLKQRKIFTLFVSYETDLIINYMQLCGCREVNTCEQSLLTVY